MSKQVAILGSTGSIGTQALEVVAQHPEEFHISVLTARNNIDLLVSQALSFLPEHVVVTNKDNYRSVADALSGLSIQVHSGEEELAEVVIEHLRPIQSRFKVLMEDPHHINNLLARGAEKVRPIAERTMVEVNHKLGLG